ncbi:hypothetical protein HQ520_18085 [bacterium]|nr:hypothetical protein [bacterium]
MPHVIIPFPDHDEVTPTSSDRFRNRLSALYRQRYGQPPSSEGVKQARIQVEARCDVGLQRELSNRVAQVNSHILYDLSNERHETIEIRPDGWEVVSSPPIFRRYRHQRPQVSPVTGRDPKEILRFVNIPEDQQSLFMITVASWFVPRISRPIMVLSGEPGTGKSTTTRFIKDVVDPSQVPTLETPRDPRDLVQNLDHHWCPAYDNLSTIPDWLSDSFCRAVTGEGTATRRLYTDDEDHIRRYQRCILINAISNPAFRVDFLDRAILIESLPIPSERRLPEMLLSERWHRALSGILGGFFDAISLALQRYPHVQLDSPPRMADFARWGCALAHGLGYSPAAFLRDYEAAIKQKWADAVESSDFARIVALIVRSSEGRRWIGSASDLLRTLRNRPEAVQIDLLPKVARTSEHRTQTSRSRPSGGWDRGVHRTGHEG